MIKEWLETGLAKPGKSGIGLAQHLKIDPSQVSRLKKGSRRLQAEEIRLVAEYLEEPVPKGLLRPLIGTYDPDTSDPAATTEERGSGIDVRASWPEDAIAELVAEGGLGTGQVIASVDVGNMKTVDEVKEEYWKFPSSFVRGTLNTTPLKMLVVECTGDSMEPTLHSGDRVWVNTGHVRPTPDGLYAIRDAFGAVIVKRLEIAQERPIRLRIISDNAKHNPREVDEHDITIVGKVVAGLRLF